MDGQTFSNSQYLTAQLKKGNKKAYSYLVEYHYQALCAYAISLTKDGQRAEDIVQNVLVRLWQNRKKLKPELPIKHFLYRSIHNEFIDQYRKEGKIVRLEKKYIEALDKVVRDGEDEESIEKLIQSVWEEIKKLPPMCREVMLLSKQNGLTNIEISEYLGVSKKAVEKQITKGFCEIRKKLGARADTILFLLFKKPLNRGVS